MPDKANESKFPRPPSDQHHSLGGVLSEIAHCLNNDPETFQILIDAAAHPEQFIVNGKCLLSPEMQEEFRRVGEEGLARLQNRRSESMS